MARRRASFWTCKRVEAGEKCLHRNPNRLRKCAVCGKAKPAPKRPKHMVALESTYEDFVALNGGEFCGICGAPPKTRRLDRDHDHKTGRPRGALCSRCNRLLHSWLTEEWLLAAASYLRRHAERAA